MSARQIFSLAVRLQGLYFVYHGLTLLPGLFASEDMRVTFMALISATFYLACAWWLLVGGPLPAFFKRRDLTDLAYRDEAGGNV
ncbi:MAG: hypothetical protein JWO08_1098 [Verrucomicrobiaceae bacterium]|nr:hypothetical protein [Verrucomicrobiaceae bacterium]